jgi:hypothetical protein
MRGGDAVVGVLDRDAGRRSHAELRGGLEIERRVGLAMRHVVERQQRFETIADAGEAEVALGRAARGRGHDRHRAFRGGDGVEQVERA